MLEFSSLIYCFAIPSKFFFPISFISHYHHIYSVKLKFQEQLLDFAFLARIAMSSANISLPKTSPVICFFYNFTFRLGRYTLRSMGLGRNPILTHIRSKCSHLSNITFLDFSYTFFVLLRIFTPVSFF